jgi:hypothetical protein
VRQRYAAASTVENWLALAVVGAIFYVGFDIVRDVLLGEPPDLRNIWQAAVVRRFGSVVAAQINLTVYDRVLQAYAEQ